MPVPPGCRLPGSSWCSRLMTSSPSATGLSRRDGRSPRTPRTGPWGLKDFRILDPAGSYLRITDRAG